MHSKSRITSSSEPIRQKDAGISPSSSQAPFCSVTTSSCDSSSSSTLVSPAPRLKHSTQITVSLGRQSTGQAASVSSDALKMPPAATATITAITESLNRSTLCYSSFVSCCLVPDQG